MLYLRGVREKLNLYTDRCNLQGFIGAMGFAERIMELKKVVD